MPEFSSRWEICLFLIYTCKFEESTLLKLNSFLSWVDDCGYVRNIYYSSSLIFCSSCVLSLSCFLCQTLFLVGCLPPFTFPAICTWIIVHVVSCFSSPCFCVSGEEGGLFVTPASNSNWNINSVFCTCYLECFLNIKWMQVL